MEYDYNDDARSLDSISLTTHSIDFIGLQLQEGELVWLSYRWGTDFFFSKSRHLILQYAVALVALCI